MASIDGGLPAALALRLQGTRSRVTRRRWMDWIEQEIGLEPGDAGFDRLFAGLLAGMMRDCGYPHVAAGILGAAADIERDMADRVEFDGLVDLAMRLIVQDTEL